MFLFSGISGFTTATKIDNLYRVTHDGKAEEKVFG